MQYKIEGDTLPVVICTLAAGETMITERGSMSWMSPNMKMETTSGGGLGKIAINYGYHRFQPDMMWIAVVLLVLLVQLIQAVGDRLVVKSDKRRR